MCFVGRGLWQKGGTEVTSKTGRAHRSQWRDWLNRQRRTSGVLLSRLSVPFAPHSVPCPPPHGTLETYPHEVSFRSSILVQIHLPSNYLLLLSCQISSFFLAPVLWLLTFHRRFEIFWGSQLKSALGVVFKVNLKTGVTRCGKIL